MNLRFVTFRGRHQDMIDGFHMTSIRMKSLNESFWGFNPLISQRRNLPSQFFIASTIFFISCLLIRWNLSMKSDFTQQLVPRLWILFELSNLLIPWVQTKGFNPNQILMLLINDNRSIIRSIGNILPNRMKSFLKNGLLKFWINNRSNIAFSIIRIFTLCFLRKGFTQTSKIGNERLVFILLFLF